MQIGVVFTIYASAPRFTCLKGYQNQSGVFYYYILFDLYLFFLSYASVI